MPFQIQYDINLQRGYNGVLAEGAGPFQIDRVPAQVPAAGRNPRPGDQVYWDRTNNGAASTTTTDQQERSFGIVTYFPGILGSLLASIPAGANSATYVEYLDGDVMPVIVMGTAWLLAGGALEYGTQIVQTAADRDWVSGTDDQPSNLNVMLRCPVTCADVAVADTGIFKGRIGYGRVY